MDKLRLSLSALVFATISAPLILESNPVLQNDLIQTVSPSELRTEFKDELGIDLRGFEKDIEGDPMKVSVFSTIIYREGDPKELGLESIRVESEDSTLQTIVWTNSDNWMQLHGSTNGVGIGGLYSPKRFDIHLSHNSLWDVTSHEVKHHVAGEIIKVHPEFKERWLALTIDDEGNSLYVGKKWDSLSYAHELGFVSDYARCNIGEDMAELAADVESGHFYSVERINASPRLKGKIELAQEFGLIQPDFLDFQELSDMLHEVHSQVNYVDPLKAKEYFAKSKAFLNEHPQTRYEGEIRSDRAYIMLESAKNDEDYVAVIHEVEKALRVEFKDTSYVTSLGFLADAHTNLNDGKGDEFRKAGELYWDRFHNGDPSIARVGVNDYLQERGLISKDS